MTKQRKTAEKVEATLEVDTVVEEEPLEKKVIRSIKTKY